MEGNVCISTPALHLLVPLCIYWSAEEMSVSVIADITTNALCPAKSTCSQAIYLNGLQQMVSVALLIIAPMYMMFFLTETVKLTPNLNQHLRWSSKYKLVQDRYSSMRYVLHVVTSSSTLKCICLFSFFYDMGMSGISSVLMYYLKSAFDFDKNQFSEILLMVGVGSIITQMLFFPLANRLVGERVVLRIALLASITYALLYGLAWTSWVPYFGALFRMVYLLERPSTNAIVSKASSSSDQSTAILYDKRKLKDLLERRQLEVF
ncbi:hypothetical protein K7X08_003231 [Anisodus acutangulus]|uniref:Uncharacterized protein n=1 Tax=Anisodus acutangulus TaxID=402998 RepID=A0A9Q1MDG3_9SOLA|nr:hypothetical protein K7X08_003231 [Anisodus acutangulus]